MVATQILGQVILQNSSPQIEKADIIEFYLSLPW